MKDGEFKEVKRIPQPSAEVLKAGGNKVKAILPVESGGCVYKVWMRWGWGLKGWSVWGGWIFFRTGMWMGGLLEHVLGNLRCPNGHVCNNRYGK